MNRKPGKRSTTRVSTLAILAIAGIAAAGIMAFAASPAGASVRFGFIDTVRGFLGADIAGDLVADGTGKFEPYFAGVTYYSQGSLAPNLTSSWDTNRGGGGTAPANFTGGDIFVVQNGHSMTATGLWTVSGAGSKVLIETGGTITSSNQNHSLTLDMQSGATWIHTNSTYGNLTFGTLDSNSNFQMNNSSGFSASRTYPNLVLNFSGSINPGASAVTINGNLDIRNGADFRGSTSNSPTHTIGGDILIATGGIWTLTNGTGAPIYNISGTVTNSGGTISAPTANGTSTINFNGANSKTVTWGTHTGNDYSVNIASTKTVTFADNFAIATGTLAVNGTLNCGTNVVSGAGAFSLASGGTLGIGSAVGITSSGATGNIQVAGTRTFNTAANYTYNGLVNQATGNGLPATVNNLTVANTGSAGSNTVTLGSDVTVSGTLAVTNGVLGSTGGTTRTVTGPVTVSSGASIAPGASAGKIATGNVSFSSGSNFNVELGGTTAITEDDVLSSSGSVSLGNATLNISSINTYVPTPGLTFTILEKTSPGAISGTFNGLPEGATISTNFLGSGNIAKISYVGGDGNDVTVAVYTTYSVTYNGNGNTGGSAPVDGSSPYAAGSTVTVLNNTGSLVKTGEVFYGWNTQADGLGTNYAPGGTFTINANTTLYAKWLAVPSTLIVNDTGDGSDASAGNGVCETAFRKRHMHAQGSDTRGERAQ